MVTIEMMFPSGRYHATPWGRNVNEGDVEWPPSPYRMVRALIDVWKRRKPDWQLSRVMPIFKALSSKVKFHLPPAVAAHTRSFLSSNDVDLGKKQLIFDAFVVLDRKDRILMGLECDLSSEVAKDFDELLSGLNFFGRSESWCKARILQSDFYIDWNSFPLDYGSSVITDERIRVACIRQEDDFFRIHNECGIQWLEALSLTTGQLLRDGWSDPPALIWVDYVRPLDALTYTKTSNYSAKSNPAQYYMARYALSSSILPSIRETLPFAERVRGHLMGIHKRICNGDPSMVSRLFSGKSHDGRPLKGHRHAFFLPLDEDGDGRLDHMIIVSKEAYDSKELMSIDQLRSVWQPNGRPDVRFVLVALKDKKADRCSRKWVSATPYVTARHYRKGRGEYEDWIARDILKECQFHGLPPPISIERIQGTAGESVSIRWLEFRRGRKNLATSRGHGFILGFDKLVEGPFALGSECHFGLGLFQPFED